MKTLARRADLEALLRRTRLVRLDHPARWGRMSAAQMICHLADAFRMALGDKPVQGVATLPTRSVVKWLALYQPWPWPPGFATRPEIDQAVGGTRPTMFTRDADEVESLMRRVAEAPRDFAWPPHPVFGPLTWAEWQRWGYRHTDHHLRQFGV